MALKDLHGRVAWIFQDEDFDVDQIIGVKNIKIKEPEELSKLCLIDEDDTFVSDVKTGDLLVGNHNFGYGHPHYPPMIGMRHLGVAGVIAESFAPGYWRGEIAMGFPQVVCPGITRIVSRWDEIHVSWKDQLLVNHTKQCELKIEPLSDSDAMMLEAGGIVGYLHARDAMEEGNGK